MEDPRDTPRRRIAMIDGGLGGFGALAALAMMARPIAGEVRIAAEAALPVRKDPLHTAAPAPAELTRQQAPRRRPTGQKGPLMRAGGRKPAIYDFINRLAVDPDTAKDALILWLMARLLEAEQRLAAARAALGRHPRRG